MKDDLHGSSETQDLPVGWAVARIAEFTTKVGSGATPRGGSESYKQAGIPLIRSQNVHLDGFRDEGLVYIDEQQASALDDVLVYANDVLLNITGASIGRVTLAPSRMRGARVNQHVCIIRPIDGILPRYLANYLANPGMQTKIMGAEYGVTRQALTKGQILGFEIPIAPLTEQKRIVAKVEALLARVNAARERLAKVPALLKRFRQSVLAAACSGQLTADWRADHADVEPTAAMLSRLTPEAAYSKRRRAGRLWGGGTVPELTDEERNSIPESWSWVKVANIGSDPADAVQVGPMSMQSRDFTDTGVPVLNVGCVQYGYFDESKLDHMPQEIAAAFERYRIQAGDVLFTRSGTIGRCAVAGDQQSGHLMTFHLLRVRPDSRRCSPEYAQFVFQGATHIRRQMDEAAIGSTRAGFNTSLLANLDVPLPPLEEQSEILRRVKALFAFANKIEARVQAATARVEKITQAILAKAFRGELVPTEAELARQEGRDYEPATVLLDRIRAERAAGETGKSKATRTGRRKRPKK